MYATHSQHRIESIALGPSSRTHLKAMSNPNPYRPPKSPAERVTLREVVSPTGLAWKLILTVSIISLLVGLISRYVRPMITGPIHYEMIVAIFIQISLVLGVLWVSRHRPLRDGIISANLAIAAVWGAFFIGGSVVHGTVWGDVVGLTAVFWVASAIFGSLAMYALHRIRR